MIFLIRSMEVQRLILDVGYTIAWVGAKVTKKERVQLNTSRYAYMHSLSVLDGGYD